MSGIYARISRTTIIKNQIKYINTFLNVLLKLKGGNNTNQIETISQFS